jgi:hypothetical protein
LYKTRWNCLAINWRERGKTYNGSRTSFHFAICPSTETSAVSAVVLSESLDTDTKNFLLRKGCFLITGTLSARRTKQKINHIEASSNLYLTSTNPTPERFAWMIVYLDIQRFECCSKMVLHENHYAKERIDAPSSCALRCRGTWAGVMGHY